MRAVALSLILVAPMLACSSEDPSVESPASDAGADVTDTHPHVVPDTRPEVEPEIPPPEVPATLAETGLYSDFAARTLAPGVIPFDVRYPLWSDGGDKSRFLYIPPGTQIDTSDMDHWSFPIGTKSWKEFRRDGVLVETRYLEKSGEKPIGWKFVAYVWSADGKSAREAKLGAVDALGTAHDVPSQEHCEQCHSGTRDGLIGVGAIQLSGETSESPLAVLESRGLLSVAPGRQFAVPGAGVVKDALGYLHGNCGYCHSDQGRWAAARQIRLRVRVSDREPEQTPTYLTTINVPMAHGDLEGDPYIGVVPGNAARSHVYDRMQKRDFWAMPPVGSERVDETGSALIRAWIESLPK